MDVRPLSTVGRLVPCCEPSVLIVQSHANCLETLPHTLTAVLPDVAFDACESQDDWLSQLNSKQYHAVLSDARSAEADHYLLLRRAQELWCPVPVVLAKGTGDYQAVRRALTHGALDMIPSPPHLMFRELSGVPCCSIECG